MKIRNVYKRTLTRLGKQGRESQRRLNILRWYPEEKRYLDSYPANSLYPTHIYSYHDVGITYRIGGSSEPKPRLSLGNTTVYTPPPGWLPPPNTTRVGARVVYRPRPGQEYTVYVKYGIESEPGIHTVVHEGGQAKLYLWEPIAGCGWYKGLLVPDVPMSHLRHQYAQQCYDRKARYF